jgi:NADH-quinone oxidoreductase subunit J
MNALFFWFFSIAMIVCALAVVLGRNPVTSAICFAFTIFYMSALFVMLDAFFLAAVQILVTAGAVMVLFLFIIMLLDLTGPDKVPRQRVWMGCALILAMAFLYVVALTLSATPEGAVSINDAPQPTGPSGKTMEKRIENHPGASEGFLVDLSDDTHRIGRLLFSTGTSSTGENLWQTTYVAPFEVTSLLILVATIGVIVLCKQDEPRRPAPREQLSLDASPKKAKPEPVSTR